MANLRVDEFEFQRQPRLEIPKLRALAKGSPCMVRVFGVCNHDDATTVWAHSNRGWHGKGKGMKAHDCFGAFACAACHDWLDNKVPNVPHEEREAAMEQARDRTLFYLFVQGHLEVKK